MASSLTSKEFLLLQKIIEDRCGILLGEEKAYLIESRLSKLLIDYGFSSFEELYFKLYKDNDTALTEKVIDAITTNETLWFRDKSPWEILGKVLLAQFIKEIREGKRFKVRIWSAASSTGQEPYSTAMYIDNYLSQNMITDVTLSHFEIIATDISQTVLQVAKTGKFDSISIMRGLDETYKSKYFINEGRVWTLNEKIRKAVTFQQFNLQNSFLMLGKFDVIFLRYVVIYFSEKLKQEIFTKVFNALNKNGVLFIGSSELYPNHKDSFDMEYFNNSVYYRVRGDLK